MHGPTSKTAYGQTSGKGSKKYKGSRMTVILDRLLVTVGAPHVCMNPVSVTHYVQECKAKFKLEMWEEDVVPRIIADASLVLARQR